MLLKAIGWDESLHGRTGRSHGGALREAEQGPDVRVVPD